MSRTPNPARDLGISIREARSDLGWTQYELAKRAKVSRPTIARVETGGNVSTGSLRKILDALGKDLTIT
ncbi:helix-turn-helix transcriptional regulator [Bifidobacterium mongoliense]|uniref:helix-turn-helix transcriptional regulator n=1 Tax=Bifidobacterium mongoliense TaxID=518643 RepID=UPI0030EE3BAE